MDYKQQQDLNEAIDNIINENLQSLNEVKMHPVHKKQVSQATKKLGSVRTVLDNMKYMLNYLSKDYGHANFHKFSTEEAEKAWNEVNSALRSMNILISHWNQVIDANAEAIKNKLKK